VRVVALHTENKSNAKVRLAQYDHVITELVKPGEPTIVAGDLNTVSAGEGPAFRRELQARNQKHGRASSLFDCSRGDDTTTFSAALIVNLRIDWMLVQSGTGDVLDCPAGSYKVRGHDGASDHKPVITEMSIK
jgi:endonuclease/exonuclease/phosphatase family metal-dependent hydrolase